MSTVHDLKCWPNYFTDVLSGKKAFELRFNDRNFKVGDEIRLREWIPPQQAQRTSRGCYTGRSVWLTITYVLNPNPAADPDCGLVAGYVALGIKHKHQKDAA